MEWRRKFEIVVKGVCSRAELLKQNPTGEWWKGSKELRKGMYFRAGF